MITFKRYIQHAQQNVTHIFLLDLEVKSEEIPFCLLGAGGKKEKERTFKDENNKNLDK